jgi:hypothetical protein
MTTTTEPTAVQRVTLARVVRSEWTKLRSVPSTAWSLLAAAALIVGFGALYSMVRVTRPPREPAAVASFDPTVTSVRPDPVSLGPWTGLGLFCLYTAVLLALGAWRLWRRDA